MLFVVTCFSSFVCADNFSYLTDASKKESMINYRNSKISMCLNESSQDNKKRSGQEVKAITDACSCVVDVVINDFLGEGFILNNDMNTIIKGANNYLDNKDKMIPILVIEGCKSK